MGVGPIPFTTIDRYADRYEFDDPDEFDFLKRMVREMDDEYLLVARRTAKQPKPE